MKIITNARSFEASTQEFFQRPAAFGPFSEEPLASQVHSLYPPSMRITLKCLGFLFLLLTCAIGLAAGSDFLATDTMSYQSCNPAVPLEKTVTDLRSIFLRYEPGVDSSTQIVNSPAVTGTASLPHLATSLRKCVFIICKTVEVEADIRIQKVSGPCAGNYELIADLHGSGETLLDNYSAIEVDICSQPINSSQMKLISQAKANCSNTYSHNPIQSADLDVLRLQIQPMIKALHLTLQANGARILQLKN